MLKAGTLRNSIYKTIPALVCVLGLATEPVWAAENLVIQIAERPHARFQASCAKVLESLATDKPVSVSQFQWIGAPPPEKHFQPYFYERAGFGNPPNPGDTLEVLTLGRMRGFMSKRIESVAGEEYFFLRNIQGIAKQKVRPNTDYENRLIAESFKHPIAREVASNLLEFDTGEKAPILFSIYAPPFSFTEPFEFYPGAPEEIDFHPWEISDLLTSLNEGGKKVKSVELFHTHPVVQIWNQSSRRGNFHPLSDPDLDAPRELSLEHPGILFRVTAVAPNGYSFSAEFMNGELVTD